MRTRLRFTNMTFLAVLALLILFTGGPLYAQEDGESEGDDVQVDLSPGDLTVSGSVGFGYAFSLAFYPGVEFFVAEKDFEDGINLDFGVAGKGLYNRYSTSYSGGNWGWNTYAIGGFGTVHLSVMEDEGVLRGLDRFDFYAGLGLVYNYFDYFGPYEDYNYYEYSDIGFSGIGGLNYYLTNNFALVFEGTYWGYTGGTIGILYKF